MVKHRKKCSNLFLITLRKKITVDQMGADKVGVDKMGGRQSGN